MLTGLKLLATLTMTVVGATASYLGIDSGLGRGQPLPAYEPKHVTGADAGSNTCPVCKYGALPAVQVWVNGLPDANVAALATHLDGITEKHNTGGLHLKTFIVFRSDRGAAIETTLKDLADQRRLQQVALAWLPVGAEPFKEYEINPEARTTVFVYKNRRVNDKFVNLKADAEGLKALDGAIKKILE